MLNSFDYKSIKGCLLIVKFFYSNLTEEDFKLFLEDGAGSLIGSNRDI